MCLNNCANGTGGNGSNCAPACYDTEQGQLTGCNDVYNIQTYACQQAEQGGSAGCTTSLAACDQHCT